MGTATTANRSEQAPIRSIYILGFLLGLHMALPAYIYSSFLSKFVPENYVGLIYTAASLLTILLFWKLPVILRLFGNFKVTLITIAIAILSVLGLAILQTKAFVIAAFLLSQLSVIVLILNFDLFLEHVSKNTVTGELRGTYLVSLNIAWVLSQVAVAFALSESEYGRIFILSAAVAVPMFLIILARFRNFKDVHYHEVPILKLFQTARRYRGVISAYIVNFLLQFFYAWMIIYSPLYLHNHIGFSWEAIAFMFSIMLLPFVIVQRPLGKLADQVFGEKELLVAGFIIMGVTAGAASFLTEANFLTWTALLFVSRIGAATVEVMSETYFFKQVSDNDISLIRLFRTTRPWAYVLAPIAATVLVPFIGLQYLFLVLGGIMFYGAFQSLLLKDTL